MLGPDGLLLRLLLLALLGGVVWSLWLQWRHDPAFRFNVGGALECIAWECEEDRVDEAGWCAEHTRWVELRARRAVPR